MATESRSIDYVFTLRSPWAYIGHAALMEICRRRGARTRFRPVSLDTVFPESGDLHPRHWPFDAAPADRMVVASVRAGADPERFVAGAFKAVWEDGRDLADFAELPRLLADAGHAGDALLAAARSDAVGDAYAADMRRALSEGVFGSPSYLLDGEVFWGQDRLDMLDDALASGWAPFTSDAGPPGPAPFRSHS